MFPIFSLTEAGPHRRPTSPTPTHTQISNWARKDAGRKHPLELAYCRAAGQEPLAVGLFEEKHTTFKNQSNVSDVGG